MDAIRYMGRVQYVRMNIFVACEQNFVLNENLEVRRYLQKFIKAM